MSEEMSLRLQSKQAQQLKQNQVLMMLPRMQQAIHLLQLPVLEMTRLIEQEMERNPLLEYSDISPLSEEDAEPQEDEEEIDEPLMASDEAIQQQDLEVLKRLDDEFREFLSQNDGLQGSRTLEDDKKKLYLENSIQATQTLFHFLMEQAHEVLENEEDLKIAEEIIGSLDEQGFMKTPIGEIAEDLNLDSQRVKNILEIIQTFEPHGIAAKSTQESLLIQLQKRGRKDSLAYEILKKGYQDLIHNRIPLLQKNLGCSAEQIRKAIKEDISKLDLHPGTGFSQNVSMQICPDVNLRQEDQKLIVEVNEEPVPFFKLNPRYLRMFEQESLSEEMRSYLRHHILSAKWLVKNILQRNDTLTRITRFLAEKQKQFFLDPQGQLSPLTMKEVAEHLELHESTIARAVANKYMNSPRGLLPLRGFFTNAYINAEGDDISSDTVRQALFELIEKEDKRHPYSDEQISKKLKEKGIQCARRTIAKYRRESNIGNAQQRRHY